MAKDLTFSMAVDMARRHTALIVAVILVTFSLGATIIFRMPNVYTATAIIIVDPSVKDLLRPEDGAGGSSKDMSKVDSEVELVRPDNVLMAVIDELHLDEDADFKRADGFRQTLLSLLGLGSDGATSSLANGKVALVSQIRAVTSVRRVGLTNLISIEARSSNPDKAARLANAIANNYISAQLNSKIASLVNARAMLAAEQARALELVSETSLAYTDMIDDIVVNYADVAGNTSISTLQQRLQKSVQQNDELALRIASAEEILANGKWDQFAAGYRSPEIMALDQQRQQLIASIKATTDPVLINQLNAQLGLTIAQIGQLGETVKQGLREQQTKIVAEQSNLRQQIRTAVLDSELPPDVVAKTFELQQKAQVTVKQYESLLLRNEELGTQSGLQVADSRVASPALSPAQPSSPNIPYLLAIVGAISITSGGAIAFARDFVTGGFTSEADTQTLGLARVSSVPMHKGKLGETQSIADQIALKPLSRFAESVRRIRSMLDAGPLATPDVETQARVIAVMSTHANEGKTTLALSLARSYALSGQKVLVIDADLRKPGLHQVVGLEPTQGLLEILKAEDLPSAISKAVNPDPLSTATLLLGRTVSDDSTDQFISGNGFRSLLQASRRLFNIIIVDTPPLDPVVDGIYLSQQVDQILFVLEWEKTRQSAAKVAISELSLARGTSEGVFAVLNKSNEKSKFSTRADSAYYRE